METIKSNSKKAIEYAIAGTILLLMLTCLKVYANDDFIIGLVTLFFGIASVLGFIHSIKGRSELQTKRTKAALIINTVLLLIYLILMIISTLKKLNYL